MLDELACAQVRERAIEREHERRVDAGVRQQTELLLHAHQAVGADLGAQERQRVAVERHRDAARTGGRSIHPRAVDDRAMPRVHAVELADRDDGGAEARGHLTRIAEDDHEATAAGAGVCTSAAGWCVASHQMPRNGSTSGTNR